MATNCKYHPTRQAHWVCPKCQAGLCPSCVVSRDKSGHALTKEKVYLCPDCNVKAEWVGAASLVEPFWTRLPSIFAYPLKPGPLALNVGLSLLALLLGWVPFVNMLIGMVLIKYAFDVLKKTAYGDLRPPSLDEMAGLNNMGPVLQQWILFFLLYLLGGFIWGAAGVWGAVLYGVAVILLLPAMIILQVTSESLAHALNPMMSIGMVARIGGGYFVMWLFLAFLLSAPGTLIFLAAKLVPKILLGLIINLVKNYYTVVSYFLMGYVILQYHEQLNYEIDFEDFHDPSSQPEEPAVERDPQEGIINQVAMLTKEGRIDEALAYIKEATAAGGITSLVLLERFYKLLKLKKDEPAMIEAGEQLISRLSQAGQQEAACQVYIECASRKAPLKLPARDLIKLGGWLLAAGKHKAAVNALNRMIKQYPDDALTPKAYFQLAQIYNEKLNDVEKSKKIIDMLIKQHPHHDFTDHARRYLATLPA